ncbi:hypothetical protein JAAARDRAFT_198747 [Jaapia argillacea MUCL 33604]|uniref:Uncharacterized protein n=1 Tax=Jaapia argillacea MUCL 33604 TaxID=933084 RepID=A0A067PAC2_9AGAM|nr:hypothetical protein JAAARDRAFT_198747 [Jaapia argillacea MUCL 33604]
MSITYSDNGYNGESPLVMSLPDLIPSTTSLPPYGSSCKEDNDDFDSIYYNPPVKVKREPLSPRILTPLSPHIPTPIANYKTTGKTESSITSSPSTPLTEPPALGNLWLGTNFRASYNVWGNTINNHKSPSPSPPPLHRSGRIPSTKCWNSRSPVPVPTPSPCPWTPPAVIPAYVEPEVGPAFTWPPPPLKKFIAQGPNMMLAGAYSKHLEFLNQQETHACQGVQVALELWMSWARMREQHFNITVGRDWPQVALVYRRAPPPPNQDLYIPQMINFNGPLPSNNIQATSSKIRLAEMPGPSWDEWNKFTGSQKLAFQEKYWA